MSALTPAAPRPSPARRLLEGLRRAEDGLACLAVLLMAGLPVAEMTARFLGGGVPGAGKFVENLTLWVGFVGAMIASREKRHLAIAAGADRLPPSVRRWTGALTAAVSAGVAISLAWAAWDFLRTETESSAKIVPGFPAWTMFVILPFSYLVVALRFVAQAEGWAGKGIAALGLPAAWVVGFVLAPHAPALVWPGVVLLVAAGLLGAPMFVAIGGSALFLFHALAFDGVRAAAIPVATAQLVVSSSVPTIPLFTVAGCIIAAGKSNQRLLRLFQALFGWMPGGLAVVATLVCAFFTTFTGASGVTILALGGLLLPMLVRSGYSEKFSVGLLTSSGSIGLLFPPSLPVILYAVQAKISILDLFKAAALPGALLVLAVAVLGFVEAARRKVERHPFSPKEAAAALWGAKWELALPVIALWGIFGGAYSLIEVAALTVVYAVVVEVVVLRELSPFGDLPKALVQSVILVGGVLAILGVAMGLTNYLVDEEIPMKGAEWIRQHVHSKWVFLIVLNLVLIVVGAMMDIFSAILVVVPLMLPAAQAYGIHPVHLGVIFLANLELGYLVPPVGENLFLASYRFDRPILTVARWCLPFILAILLAVLIITYAPGLALIDNASPPPPP